MVIVMAGVLAAEVVVVVVATLVLVVIVVVIGIVGIVVAVVVVAAVLVVVAHTLTAPHMQSVSPTQPCAVDPSPPFGPHFKLA